MRTVMIIPARYHSSRLPGKPLADIEGETYGVVGLSGDEKIRQDR